MPGINDVTIPLNHETELQQNVEVHSASTQIDPETTSHEETLVQRQMIDTPVPTDRDVQQSLTTMPQVLADCGRKIARRRGAPGPNRSVAGRVRDQ